MAVAKIRRDKIVNRKALKVRPNPSRPFRGTIDAEGEKGEMGNHMDLGGFSHVDEAGDALTPEMNRGGNGAVDETKWNGSAPGSRKWSSAQCALCLIMVASAFILSACGKGATIVPSTQTIVSLTQVPPSPFPLGQVAQVIATVANDPSQMGVNWSVSCESSSCGSFSPTHTLSGQPSFYTAPNAVPNGNSVNITATSVYNPAQHVTVTIVLTTSSQPIGITFTQSPPATVVVSQSYMFIATVTNDPTNAGVTWEVTCAGGSFCGSYNQGGSSPSGQPITYTAPPSPPGNGGLVNIIAMATADPTVMITVQTTVVTGSGGEQIMFNPAPPNTLQEGTTAQLIADLTGSSAQIDWSVTCGSASCGSFNPTVTDSGSATTYTAPSTPPTGNTVTVTATAADNANVNVSATITITSPTGPDELLNGQYAISFSGTDTNGFYAATGAFVADGMGNISGGEEDFLDPATLQTPAYILTGSYYNITSNGVGTMYLLNNFELGAACNSYPVDICGSSNQLDYVQIISFAVVNSSHSLVIEFDFSATSHGSMDLQTITDFNYSNVSSGYSFLFPGVDANTYERAALGGVFTADGNGNFTTGIEDVNDNGTVTLNYGSFAGTYNNSTIDSFGRATVCVPSDCSEDTFSFYIVNNGQLNFIETDETFFIAAGPAFSNGSGTFSGAYGFTGAGWVKKDARAEGGLFTASGGSITGGIIDLNDAGSSPTLDTPFTGSYSTFVSGRGTLTLNTNASGIGSFQAYVTDSNGVLLLETDKGSVSSGAALAQTLPITDSTFNGNYAAYYQSYPEPTSPNDVVGQVIASDSTFMLSGTANVNEGFNTGNASQTAGWTVSGMFTVESDGRFYPGSLDLTLNSMSLPADEIYYVLNSSTVLMLDYDPTIPGVGLLQLQDLTIPGR
jgi:hypothetical protein